MFRRNKPLLLGIFCLCVGLLYGCRESLNDVVDPVDREKMRLLIGHWELMQSIPETGRIHLDFQEKNRVLVIYPDIPDTTRFGYFVREGFLILYTLDPLPDRDEFEYFIAELDRNRLVLHLYAMNQVYMIQTYYRS